MLRCSSWCRNGRATWRVPNAPLPDCRQLLHFAVKTDVDCVENERPKLCNSDTPIGLDSCLLRSDIAAHTHRCTDARRPASPVRIWRTDTGLRACERRWPALLDAPANPASRAWQTQQAPECRGEPLMRRH